MPLKLIRLPLDQPHIPEGIKTRILPVRLCELVGIRPHFLINPTVSFSEITCPRTPPLKNKTFGRTKSTLCCLKLSNREIHFKNVRNEFSATDQDVQHRRLWLLPDTSMHGDSAVNPAGKKLQPGSRESRIGPLVLHLNIFQVQNWGALVYAPASSV